MYWVVSVCPSVHLSVRLSVRLCRVQLRAIGASTSLRCLYADICADAVDRLLIIFWDGFDEPMSFVKTVIYFDKRESTILLCFMESQISSAQKSDTHQEAKSVL